MMKEDNEDVERGRELFRAGLNIEALAVFDRILERNSKRVTVHYARGLALFALGRYDEARQSFERVVEDKPEWVEGLRMLFLCLSHLKSYEKALPLLDRLAKITPEDAQIYLQRAYVYVSSGDFEEAFAEYDRAIALDGTVHWDGIVAPLMLCGNFLEALAECDRVIALDPKSLGSWINRSSACIALGRYEQAMAATDRALTIDSTNAMAWANRASALFSLKRFRQALAAISRSIELDPKLITSWVIRGQAFMLMGRFEEALASYHRAREIDPSDPEVWFKIGELALSCGSVGQLGKTDAVRAFARAFSLVDQSRPSESGESYRRYFFEQYNAAPLPFFAIRSLNQVNPECIGPTAGRLLRDVLTAHSTAFRLAEALVVDTRFVPYQRNLLPGLLNLCYGDPVLAKTQFEKALEVEPRNLVGLWGKLAALGALFYDLGTPECEEVLQNFVQAIVDAADDAYPWQRFFACRLALIHGRVEHAFRLVAAETEFVPCLVVGAWIASERLGKSRDYLELARRALAAEAQAVARGDPFRLLTAGHCAELPSLASDPHKLADRIVWLAITQESEEAMLWFCNLAEIHALPEWAALFAGRNWDSRMARAYSDWLCVAPISPALENHLTTIEQLRKGVVIAELEIELASHLHAWGFTNLVSSDELRRHLASVITEKDHFETDRLLIRAIGLFWMRGQLSSHEAERFFHYALARKTWVEEHDPDRYDVAVASAANALGLIIGSLLADTAGVIAASIIVFAGEDAKRTVKRILRDRSEGDPFPNFEKFSQQYDRLMREAGVSSRFKPV